MYSRIVEDPTFPAAQGKITPNIPPWRWTVVASYRPNEQLTATVAARLQQPRVGHARQLRHLHAHVPGASTASWSSDARVNYEFDKHWSGSVGIDNLNNRRYFLFHPFPQVSLLGQIAYKF